MAILLVAFGLWRPELVTALDLPASAVAEAAREGDDPRAIVELLTDAAVAAPGDRVRVGVRFRLDPHWHVYWRNPGGAAFATDISFDGEISPGPLSWPAPTRFEQADGMIVTFGYAEEVVLFAAGAVEDADGDGRVTLAATADFLVCKVDCIPDRVTVRRTIDVGPHRARPEEAAAIDAAAARVPVDVEDVGWAAELALAQDALRPGDTVQAAWGVVTCAGPPEDGASCPSLEAPASGTRAAFFPDRVPGLEVRVDGVRAHPGAYAGAVIDLTLVAGPDAVTETQTFSGVLHLQSVTDGAREDRFVEVSGPLPRASKDAAVAASDAALLADLPPAPDGTAADGNEGTAANAGTPLPLWQVFLYAFLGGLILNLMPCVLPVLAIKVVGLTRLAGSSQRAVVGHAAAYTAGVVGAMLALAAVVIGFRAAGTEVGWGFHLQEPVFVALVAAVLFAFALSLLGAFHLGVRTDALAARVDRSEGVGRSLGEGVLAVVVATPCSAPMLGTAVGFALASSATTIVLVFLSLGVGLALPFVVIAVVPWARRLVPRPGRWMRWLEVGLAVALFGTVAWLAWVLSRVAGTEGLLRLGAFLFVSGAAAFAYGQAQKRGLRFGGIAALAAVALLGLAILRFDAAAVHHAEDVGGLAWQPWERAAVAREVSAGRTAFVDFTADWCITCKANEGLVLEQEPVRSALAEEDVVLFKADWTLRDERIRAELARHGKAGVPLYLVFRPGAEEPEVLPEILQADRVLEALRGS